MKKQTKIILYTAITLVIALLIILPSMNSSKTDQSSDKKGAPKGKNSILSVNAHIIRFEDISNTVSSIGTVLAGEEVEIRSETSGRLVKIYFREGSFVKKGDLLVKINDAELQAQLDKTKYRINYLRDIENRQKALFEKQLISKEEYDASLNEVNILNADLNLLNAQIAKTEIHAPFNGKIGIRKISEGSYVTPATIITNLQNISELKIDFTVPEKYASVIKQGDIIHFKPSAEKDFFDGKVFATEPKINTATRTLQIRGIYSNKGNKIVPGSFVDVRLELEKIKNAILIPSYAMIPELKGNNVFVYRHGTALQQSVQTGLRTENKIQISSGLNAGDTIITSGILQLKSGAKVKLSSIE